MSDLKFQKNKENFVCEHCGREVIGDGFTNHCPDCLYSKHVDVFPGDRAAVCGGIMEPVGVEQMEGEWSLIHKCLKCGAMRKNKISPGDNFNEVIRISAKN